MRKVLAAFAVGMGLVIAVGLTTVMGQSSFSLVYTNHAEPYDQVVLGGDWYSEYSDSEWGFYSSGPGHATPGSPYDFWIEFSPVTNTTKVGLDWQINAWGDTSWKCGDVRVQQWISGTWVDHCNPSTEPGGAVFCSDNTWATRQYPLEDCNLVAGWPYRLRFYATNFREMWIRAIDLYADIPQVDTHSCGLIDNSTFDGNSSVYWSLSGATVISEAVRLDLGDQITTTFTTPVSGTYYVSFDSYHDGDFGALFMSHSNPDRYYAFSIESTTWDNYAMDLGQLPAGEHNLTFRAINYTSTVWMDNICVYAGSVEVQDCVFINYSFDNGSTGWSSIGEPAFTNDEAHLDYTEGISQTFQFPEPGSYRLRVNARSLNDVSRLYLEVGNADEGVIWDERYWIGVFQDWENDMFLEEILPSQVGRDYFVRISSDYDNNGNVLVIYDVCLEKIASLNALGHPLCPDDSQNITQGYSASHQAIDYAVPIGRPVFAAGAGTVITVTRDISDSLYISIEHDNGYRSYHVHLSETAVYAGMRVSKFQLIGWSGDSGYATGPHLHFAVKESGGDYVDPNLVMDNTYPDCLGGVEDCMFVNGDFQDGATGWTFGPGGQLYIQEGDYGAVLAATGWISQAVYLPAMPEDGYYTLVFDTRGNDGNEVLQVEIQNSDFYSSTQIDVTNYFDDKFIDVSIYQDSWTTFTFRNVTPGGDSSDAILIDNVCIIFTTEDEGNPADLDCDLPPAPDGILEVWNWLKWVGELIKWLWCQLRVWLYKIWLAIKALAEKTLNIDLDALWAKFVDWWDEAKTFIENLWRDPFGTIDALLSGMINGVLNLIFGIVQDPYDAVMAAIYLLGLMWDIIATIVSIIWQAINFVITLVSALVNALLNPDAIDDIDVSPMAMGIQLAQEAIASTPLVYLEMLAVGLLSYSFILWVLRQFSSLA